MKRGLVLVAGAVAAAGTLWLVFRHDPATTAFFPPCPFHALTGLHCPGCGTLRGAHALLHGDWRAALAWNPMTMLALPFLFVGVTRQTWRWSRGVEPVGARAPAWAVWSLLGVMLAVTVLRNLPVFAWLAPGA